MTGISRKLAWSCSAAIIVAGTAAWLAAETFRAADFQPDEPVQTVTVAVVVGADGENLQEPLALDLGLGFPLWLHPVGRAEGETVPFGAIPQQTTAGSAITAGSEASFTFDTAGEPGVDALLTTQQLLDGVRVSDIARIGFTSSATGNWELKAYELQVNGRVFASNDAVNVKSNEAVEAAQFQLADLGLTMAPLEEEATALRAMTEAGLASDAESNRLVELESSLAPMRAQRRKLEGQGQGTYPWFEELEFRPPWRSDARLRSLRVTVITNTHGGADTRNHIFYSAGGHKFLLAAPGELLSGDAGPQSFDLDLVATPLTAGDLRGHAIGMLSDGHLGGRVADRWHPQRILVEVDGLGVYDSDESTIDRLSLDAIRIIPPAHVAEDGSVVTNSAGPRETFLWKAGSGAGLDLAGGGALALPPVGEPEAPEPEPGLEEIAEQFPSPTPPYPDFEPEFDPFPGEASGGFGPDMGYGPDPELGWGPGPEDWGPDSDIGDQPDCGIWGPDWEPPPWLRLVFWWLLLQHFGDDPDPGPDPDPYGPPELPVVENVRFTSGWEPGGPYQVEWQVTGDEAGVSHYLVELLAIRPHEDPYLADPTALISGGAPPGTHQLGDLEISATFDEQGVYVMPIVTAVPVDANEPVYVSQGPIRPILPEGFQMVEQFAFGNGYRYRHPPDLTDWTFEHFSWSPTPGRGAWWLGAGTTGGADSHFGLRFGAPGPGGYHLAVKPDPGDEMLVFGGVWPLTEVGQYQFVTHAGFVGGTDVGNEATAIGAALILIKAENSADPFDEKIKIWVAPETTVTVANQSGSPQPLGLVSFPIDTTEADALMPVGYDITKRVLMAGVRFEGGANDPENPPALFGIRLLRRP